MLCRNMNNLMMIGALDELDERDINKAKRQAAEDWEGYVDFQKRVYKNAFITRKENELFGEYTAAGLRELFSDSGIDRPCPSQARMVARELAIHEYEVSRPVRQVVGRPNQKKRKIQ